jgi:hypothetical protein
MDKMNLSDYFHKGYTSTNIPDVEELLPFLRSQKWHTVENNYQEFAEGNTFNLPLSADWDFKSHQNKIPSSLYEAIKDLASSGYYEWFTQIYGNFTQITVMLTKMEKGSGYDWYQDTKLGAFNGNLLFITPEVFDESDGGEISLGICDSSPTGKPLSDTVIPLEHFIPTNGLMITNYNINPNVIRKINPLKTDKELYILHFYLGYVENTLMKEMNVSHS